MQFRTLLLLGCLAATQALAQDIKKPQFLFDYVPGDTQYGMVDIASCLDLVTPDPTGIDAERWVAVVVLTRQNRVPSCAQCYTHIDGANIVGVLPIVKDTIREPFLVQSFTPYINHALPWFWTPSRPAYASTIDVTNPSTLGYLSGLTNQVTTDTLTAFVAPSATKFSYPLTANLATSVDTRVPALAGSFRSGPSVTGSVTVSNGQVAASASPYTQGIAYAGANNPGTIFNGQYLTVPDTLEPLPARLDFSSSGVAYPLAAFLQPSGNPVPPGQLATDKTIELQDRTGRSLMTVGGVQAGNLERRNDPELTLAQQTAGSENYVRMFWPAKEYYSTAAFADAGLASNLQLCGVDYEVKEYGTIHPEVMAALRGAYNTWNKTPPPGSFWVTAGNVVAATATEAHFNAVTGYWTGKP